MLLILGLKSTFVVLKLLSTSSVCAAIFAFEEYFCSIEIISPLPFPALSSYRLKSTFVVLKLLFSIFMAVEVRKFEEYFCSIEISKLVEIVTSLAAV